MSLSHSETLKIHLKQASFEYRSLSTRRNFATKRASSRGYIRTNASEKDAPAKATLEPAATVQDAN